MTKLRFDELAVKILQIILSLPVKMILKFWLKIEVIGLENLKNCQKPFILIANHPGLIDPCIITVMVPLRFLPIRWSAHRKFFKNFLCNLVLRSLGAFPIEKKASSKTHEGIDTAVKLLKEKSIVGIFPEAQLSPEKNKIGRIHRGVIIIAQEADVSVIPLVLINAHRFFFQNLPLIKRREIKIIFGKPMDDLKHLSSKEGIKKIEKEIKKLLEVGEKK